MTYDHVVAVLGANKGVGLAIVRQLALQFPSSSLNRGGRDSLLVYLASRDQQRGKDALASLQSDAQLEKARALQQHGGQTAIQLAQVDIASTDSIHQFATEMQNKHGEHGVDAVINNAGIALNGFDGEVAEKTLAINYYGTLNATRALLPLLKPDGRLVNLGSMSGRLSSGYSATNKERILAAAATGDVAGVTKLMEEFQQSVAAGTWEKAGWPSTAYGVSKAGIIAMTLAFAKQEQSQGSQKLINVCCPGFVVTDMTKGRGVKTPDQGAQTPVMLAIGNVTSTGDMWQDEKLFEWRR